MTRVERKPQMTQIARFWFGIWGLGLLPVNGNHMGENTNAR
jgi:hypothetical protein